jgi:hypothetical protein
VRARAVLPELALVGRELDGSKGEGETHDQERDRPNSRRGREPKGLGIMPLEQLPITHEEYGARLRGAGSTHYKAG